MTCRINTLITFRFHPQTVNVTARVEASGEKNRIHVSSTVASQLIDAGKEHWVKAREDKVTAKGKGELSTYWLSMDGEAMPSVGCGASKEAELLNVWHRRFYDFSARVLLLSRLVDIDGFNH